MDVVDSRVDGPKNIHTSSSRSVYHIGTATAVDGRGQQKIHSNLGGIEPLLKRIELLFVCFFVYRTLFTCVSSITVKVLVFESECCWGQ